ncbi:DUF4376 domain-containing protein [Pseudorhizobium pelagicum]|uniref:DUF4376 domain-containing protein n=1 Tax=Pseudorhizobium pelagicum TaxID=1509405 RepID=A0A922T7G1_9HYPH|nr:DUF4376 domain-containing protein [Pseudorhizobium pelagicum]KEQ05760.1 hypothetical protein GV67_04230 [Pseudorhizobium pelagicum]KEQ06440.1 hypothetical protein GV68_07225 [Pseudorhizobium pelagicum]
MKTFKMTEKQMASFSAQFQGDRSGMLYDNGVLHVPDELEGDVAAIDTSRPANDVVTSAMVNAERDRRISTGFKFNGKSYAFDAESKQRVAGAASLAGFAIANGAEEGDEEWNGPDPFAWIADDNSLTPMDAQTCFAFGQAAVRHETAHIFAARALKEMSPIPADFAQDKHWPG